MPEPNDLPVLASGQNQKTRVDPFLQRNIIDNPGLKRYISSLAKQRLRFVFGNDRAIDREDIEGELMLKAIEAARKCEEKGIDGRHCTNTLRVAVTNHCSNLATKYGAKSRNPLTRVSKADKFRTAWWANVAENKVVEVVVSTLAQHRKKNYILTMDTELNQQRFVNSQRLFDTEAEAQRGLRLYRKRGDGKRRAIVDLTVDMDDFTPTVKSFDLPASLDSETTLYNFIGGKSDKETLVELERIKNRRVRECCALVTGKGNFAAFTLWAQEREYDVATATFRELLKLAMEYCGVEKEDLERALRKFKVS